MDASFRAVVLEFVAAHVWDIAYSLIFLIGGTLLQVVGSRLAGERP